MRSGPFRRKVAELFYRRFFELDAPAVACVPCQLGQRQISLDSLFLHLALHDAHAGSFFLSTRGSATCSQSIIHSGGRSAENLSPQSTSSVCVLKVGFANQNAHASSNSRTRFGNPMGNSGKHGFAA